MYRSTDTHDRPIAITGTVVTPTTPWSGMGQRPIVSYAVGTQGVGDDCAPSKSMAARFEYEGPFIEGLPARGYGVVVTDCEGLGTPVVHTYVNRASQGHAVLDAIRAAQRLPEASLPDAGPVAIAGYSQGGGASASAAELRAERRPGVKAQGRLRRCRSDLAEVAKLLDGHYAAGFLGFALVSLDYAYPELDIPALLNDNGKRLFEQVKNECTVQAIAAHAFTQSASLTKDGRPLIAYLAQDPTSPASQSS